MQYLLVLWAPYNIPAIFYCNLSTSVLIVTLHFSSLFPFSAFFALGSSSFLALISTFFERVEEACALPRDTSPRVPSSSPLLSGSSSQPGHLCLWDYLHSTSIAQYAFHSHIKHHLLTFCPSRFRRNRCVASRPCYLDHSRFNWIIPQLKLAFSVLIWRFILRRYILYRSSLILTYTPFNTLFDSCPFLTALSWFIYDLH